MKRHISGVRYKTLTGSIFLPLFTVGLFLFLSFLYWPSQAAGGSFVVNSTADTDDGACNAADCTLREAINAANSATGEDTITFSLPPNATITLGGTQLPPILDDLTIDGSTAVNLTISGDDASRVLVVGPNPPAYPGYPPVSGSRPDGFGGGPFVTLTNLTITKGNKANDRGGGIYNNEGTLVIQNCTISNMLSRRGGIFNDGSLTIEDSTIVNNKAMGQFGAGAGIFSNYDSHLTILNSSFNSNTINSSTTVGGAAIYNLGDNLSISDSVFSGNFDTYVAAIRSLGLGNLMISNSIFSDNLLGRAVSVSGELMIEDTVFKDNNGGGLYIDDDADIQRTDFSNNSAILGGAIVVEAFADVNISNSSFTGNFAEVLGGAIETDGDLYVADSVFSDNVSSGLGGAIQNGVGGELLVVGSTFESNSAVDGGAIQIDNSNATLINSTISGNSAQNWGGGLHILGELTLQNTTITGNSAGSGGGMYNADSIHVANTIIANSPSGGDCVNSGAFLTNTNNLVEDGSCNPAFSGDPGLGGLQNNGGPTWTHYPLPGSMAIDKGDDASCPADDQRDVSRPIDGDEDGTAVCDIGAVERVAFFVVNSANDVDTGLCTQSHCSLREAIKAANSSYGTDFILFDIPGAGPHTIQPLSPLPNINRPVVIDGYSQPGAYKNTLPGQPGGNAVLMIELDGGSAGPSASGLSLTRSYIVVQGLAINGFSQHGIRIAGSGTAENEILGNFIGTDINGNGNIGNGGANVFIGSGASNNVIGGGGAVDGNIIAFAGLNGVTIEGADAIGNEIRTNAVHSNGLLGIDLGEDGVTNNDPGDGDDGANGLQNYPVLSLATADVGRTIISGSLDSTAATTYRLEFFASSACDGSGNGEGERPIGMATVATDNSGAVNIEVSVPYETPIDQLVTATTTDSAGNTSEFSPCMTVVDAPITGLVATNSSPTPLNYPVSLAATVTTGGNVNYDWYFGDGESGSGAVVNHQYPAQGWYTAVVTASNSINMMTATTVVSVTEHLPTDVSVVGFGRDWNGAGGMVWPAVGVVVLGVVLVLVVFGRRRH